MQLSYAPSFADRKSADVLILPFWQGEKKATPACPMDSFAAGFEAAVKSGDFFGKEGELLPIYKKSNKEERLLLLGLGEKEACDPERIRRSIAAAVKWCRSKKIPTVSIALPRTDFPAAVPVTEGFLMTSFVFDSLRPHTVKKDPPVAISRCCLIGIGEEVFDDCKRAEVIINAVNFSRGLIMGNADDVTPEHLADVAKSLAKDYSSVKTTILDKKKIEQEKMGLLLAVNRGSALEPRFILVEYRGNPSGDDLTALVGKGITYDTGGLNIKPGSGMITMKDDMSGGATVLGVIKAAAELKLKVNILAAIPSTENAIGSRSYKLGDVYKSHSGKTVEIIDTDAEGRLVLADALSYVQKHYKPKRIIDLATLTGGIIVALGEEVAGLFSNDDKLSKALGEAGKATYERLWRFPLYTEYKEVLKSPIADMKNAGDRKASSISGAIFIQEFVEKKVPWAHLDIAGVAFLSNPRHYHSTPATGFGVRLLVEFLSALEK
ncbi:MAG: leucyl aminopeptidase [Verrucomicrobia bacterium]|nr:leucyl aminopeptidase [Verrucomicrobiota bacterium]